MANTDEDIPALDRVTISSQLAGILAALRRNEQALQRDLKAMESAILEKVGQEIARLGYEIGGLRTRTDQQEHDINSLGKQVREEVVAVRDNARKFGLIMGVGAAVAGSAVTMGAVWYNQVTDPRQHVLGVLEARAAVIMTADDECRRLGRILADGTGRASIACINERMTGYPKASRQEADMARWLAAP